MKMFLTSVSVLCLGFVFFKNGLPENLPFFNESPALTAANMPLKNAAPYDAADVVTKALAFKALLTTTQQNTLQQTFTNTLAENWSNLPCGSGCRNGIQFSTLTTAQLTAALEVIQAAAGTAANEGYTEFQMIRAADDYLQASGGGNGYSSGIYFLSFLNTPSSTGAWMLQYGGHHYAANIAFNGGQVVGCTPTFEGVEPKTWTTSGTTYAPLNQEHDGMIAMFNSLSTVELSTAHITQTFSDVALGPNQDGNFPATKVGLKVSTLTDAQQLLVLAAMEPWVNDVDDATAAILLAVYQSELDDTYIAYSGSAALTSNANYARIDGPSVWIEFVCQTGVVFPNDIHYHSVWRDHTRDYGNYLANTTLSNSTVANTISATKLYPNPASDVLSLSFKNEVQNAEIRVYDMTGNTVLTTKGNSGSTASLNVSALARGTYIIKVEDKNQQAFTGKFIKK